VEAGSVQVGPFPGNVLRRYSPADSVLRRRNVERRAKRNTASRKQAAQVDLGGGRGAASRQRCRPPQRGEPVQRKAHIRQGERRAAARASCVLVLSPVPPGWPSAGSRGFCTG
jgi:hypothetical protein